MDLFTEQNLLTTIEPPQASVEILDLLYNNGKGIRKPVIIFYRPFSGNNLYLYDENLRLIQDALSLYNAKKIIFTNIEREPRQPFEGYVLLDREMWVHGLPSRVTRFQIDYEGGSHFFYDEFSLSMWHNNMNEKEINNVHIQ